MNTHQLRSCHPRLRCSGLVLCLVTALAPIVATAQVVFSAGDLPQQPGAHYRAYQNVADADVSSRIGPTGGPHRWDFSEPRAPSETVVRMDVVLPTDGGQDASFAGAAYAERTTRESDGSQSWSYFRIIPVLGRSYLGFFDPAANPTKPITVFDSPTIDLPARVEFGQSWTRTVEWEDLLDAGFSVLRVVIRFSSSAEVDAFGTLALDGIGDVPALRVNEVNRYEVTDLTLGLPLPAQHFRNYYWLVRGIGKAVHIISDGLPSAPPPNFNHAKTLLRVFEASELTPPPTLPPVAGLRLRIEHHRPILDWQPAPNATGYRVETTGDLGAETWRLLGEPLTSTWTGEVATTEPRQFFRVLMKP